MNLKGSQLVAVVDLQFKFSLGFKRQTRFVLHSRDEINSK